MGYGRSGPKQQFFSITECVKHIQQRRRTLVAMRRWDAIHRSIVSAYQYVYDAEKEGISIRHDANREIGCQLTGQLYDHIIAMNRKRDFEMYSASKDVILYEMRAAIFVLQNPRAADKHDVSRARVFLKCCFYAFEHFSTQLALRFFPSSEEFLGDEGRALAMDDILNMVGRRIDSYPYHQSHRAFETMRGRFSDNVLKSLTGIG